MGRHEKIETNQEPRLRTSDKGLMSVVHTLIVQGLIFSSCCVGSIIRNLVLSSLELRGKATPLPDLVLYSLLHFLYLPTVQEWIQGRVKHNKS